MIETPTVAATIDAADAGVKGARVTIRDLRLADDLGGKGYVLFGGEVAEVEAAVGYGVARTAASGQEVTHVVISQLHGEMRENLDGRPEVRRAREGRRTKPVDGGRRPAAEGSLAPRGRPLPGSGRRAAGEDRGAPAKTQRQAPRATTPKRRRAGRRDAEHAARAGHRHGRRVRQGRRASRA